MYDNIIFTQMQNIYNIDRNVRSVTFVETAKNCNGISMALPYFWTLPLQNVVSFISGYGYEHRYTTF